MWIKKIILVLAGCLMAGESMAGDNGGDLAIIVAKTSSLANLSSAELTKIFRAEKSKTPDGVKFALAMREPGSDERAAALAGIYKMSDADYGKYFLQATFVGLVQSAPRQLSSAAAMRQFVASVPGAIGYVRSSDVDDSVKTVTVDGHPPGDPAYPLKLKP